MRLTLTSAQAQRFLAKLHETLPRGKKQAPSYAIQFGISLAHAMTSASTAEVGDMLRDIEDLLFTAVPKDFPVTLDLTLYANHPATTVLVEEAQKELQVMQAELQKGEGK
jgi:hypothetical protein